MSGANTQQKNEKTELKIRHWPEPSLLFTRGQTERIIDPKHGLIKFGPHDYNVNLRNFDEVRIKVICYKHANYPITILNLVENLKKEFISKFKTLKSYPYKGFENIYRAGLETPKSERELLPISNTEILNIMNTNNFQEFLSKFKELYSQKIQDIIDMGYSTNTVIYVHIPPNLEKKFSSFKETRNIIGIGLRGVIKVMAIKKSVKTQVITEKSLSPPDIADTLWNLSLATYVKAGGSPWKLKEIPPASLFMGIRHGIRRDEKGQIIAIGIAELFNRYGEHVDIIAVNFKDRDMLNPELWRSKPYLSFEGMKKIISKAISRWKNELNSVVIHRTLDFKEEEIEGALSALQSTEQIDMLHIIENTDTRIFLDQLDTKRGTFFPLEDKRGLLYTTGYSEAENMYPGIGTPKPLELIKYYGETDIEVLSQQVLALTKMDWNTTRVMLREPVTIKYAKKVTDIIKLGPKSEAPIRDIRFYF